MPRKLRFWLEGPVPDTPFRHATGLRALVLRWIAAAAPEAAEALHAANRPKPYAVSPLWQASELPAGSGGPAAFCFEISVLADPMAEWLRAGCERSGDCIRLGSRVFRLSRVEPDRDVVEWEALFPDGGVPDAETHWTFRLLTPTAHHAPGELRKSVVLPSPELYFGSWLARWNRYAPKPFPEAVRNAVTEAVTRHAVVTACAGETRAVRLDRNRVFIGFVGEVRFGLVQASEVPPEVRSALSALARLSRYCGTGVETMRGMGQTAFPEPAERNSGIALSLKNGGDSGRKNERGA